MTYQLAQANAATTKAPFSAASMQGLTTQIAAINALAASSPGHVWRLSDVPLEALAPVANYLSHTDPERVFFNLSIWMDIETLKAFTYQTAHAQLIRHKNDWVTDIGRPSYVLWWVTAGHHPTVQEAADRFDYLAKHGPSDHAFDFKQTFPTPDHP